MIHSSIVCLFLLSRIKFLCKKIVVIERICLFTIARPILWPAAQPGLKQSDIIILASAPMYTNELMPGLPQVENLAASYLCPFAHFGCFIKLTA